MRIAVTGATGHVGANVVRDLLSRGHEVRALCRQTSNQSGLEGLTLEVVPGDIQDPEQLFAAFSGMDAVIRLAGKSSINGDPNSTVHRTNVKGTYNVARACLDAGILKLVHVSSIHAFKYQASNPDVAELTP